MCTACPRVFALQHFIHLNIVFKTSTLSDLIFGLNVKVNLKFSLCIVMPSTQPLLLGRYYSGGSAESDYLTTDGK